MKAIGKCEVCGGKMNAKLCYAPFFFAFLFRMKINYKINENNCKNIWKLQNKALYL